MKIARALVGHRPTYLVGDGSTWFSAEEIVDGSAAAPELFAAWPQLQGAHADGQLPRVEVDERDLLSPVHRPGKVIAIGLNYPAHVAEAGVEPPSAPVVFTKFATSLTGPRSHVVLDPSLTTQCDYEVELAVVIGRRTRSVPESEAMDAVFGYAVANDVSARDHQFVDGQWDRSKSFDTFCPLGPWVTTADEIEDPAALRLRTWVNDDLRQDALVCEMYHGVPFLIHYLSRGITLEPGDVILTGTPDGVGLASKPPSFLQQGDRVRCEIPGLGHLENQLVAPAAVS